MSVALRLRHERRSFSASVPWLGPTLDAPRLPERPIVSRFRRAPGAAAPGEAVADVDAVPAHPLASVARLWTGVVCLFLLIVILGLTLLTLGAWAIGYHPVVVTSGSMEPAVHPGDIVITRPVKDSADLGAQTVIEFDDPDGSGARLHRIVEVTDQGYRTKGDANPTPDSAIVPPDAVKGTGLVLAPYIGTLPLWVQEHRWAQVAITIALLGLAALATRREVMWRGMPE